MAIVAGDLVKYLTGAGSDGGAQSSPDSSLGSYRSSTTITTGVDNNLFDDVSGAEALAGDTNYRCFCIKNTHGTLALTDAKIWVSADDANSDTTYYLAIERPSVSLTAGAVQGPVASESTAPTVNAGNCTDWYLSSAINSYANGIAINLGSGTVDLEPGELIFVWVKRVIGSSASSASGISFTVTITGDTAA